MSEDIFRISSGNNVNTTSVALTKKFSEEKAKVVKISTIGASAVNQAIKSYITSRSALNALGIIVEIRPYFEATQILEEGKSVEKTMIIFSVERVQ